jgi:hypothetical protein
MYTGKQNDISDLKVRNVIISFGIKIPDSLQVSQYQPQTSEMNSNGSLEIKNVIISIGTTNS